MANEKHIDQIAVYLLGGIEQRIADYARSSRVPEDQLARRVAELFHAQTSGQVLGPQDRVPVVSGNGTRRGRPPRTLAVAGGAHPEAPFLAREEEAATLSRHGLSTAEIAARMHVSPPTVRTYLSRAEKKGISIGARERRSTKGRSYEGKHWTQLAKNKARIRKHMSKIRKTFIKSTGR